MSVSQPYVRVLLRFYDIMTKADNSTEEISKVISLPTSKMALEQRVTNDAGRLEIVWHRSSVVPSGFDSWEDLLNYYATYSKNGIADLGKAMTGQVIEVHISSTPFSGTSDYSKMKFWGRVDNFSLRYDNEDNLIVPEYKIIAYDRMKALQDFYRPYKLSAGTLYNQLYTVLTEITNVGLIDSYTSNILNTMTTKTGKGRDVSNFFELLKTICDDANLDWYISSKYEGSVVKHELIIKHRIPKRAMYDSDSSYSTALANAEASAITITPSFETEVEWDSSKIINRQIVLGKPCIPYVIRYNDDSKTWIGSGTEEDFTEGIDGVSNSNCPYYWLPRRGIGGSNNIWDSIVKTAGSYSAGFTLENTPDNDDATDWGTINSGDKKKHTARLVTYDPEKFVFDLSSGGNMVFSVRYRILASPDDIFSETSELAVNIRTQFQLRLRCYSKNGGYFQTYVNISGGKYEWFESWYFVQFWSEVKVGFNLFGTNAWESVPNAQGNMPSWAEIIAIEFYPIDPTASAKAASSGNLWIDNLHFTDFQIIGRYDDTESQAKYGIRTTEPMNDYEIPNTTVADFIAQTIVDFYKYPILRCKSPKLPIEDVLANGIDSKLGDYVKVVTENNVRITPLAQIKGIKYESKNNEITCDLEIGDVTIPDVKTTFRTLSLLLKRNMYNIETAKNVLISQGIYGLENAPIALEDLSTSLGLELEMHYIKNNLFTNLDAWTVAYADAIMADNFLSCNKRGNDWSVLTHKNEKTFSFNDDLWWRAVLELSGDEILMGYGDLAYYPPSGETGLDYWGLNNFIGFLIRKEGTTYTVYGLCVKNAGIISANKFSDELLNGDKYIKLGENFSNNQAITLMAVTRKISGSNKKIYYYVNDLNVPAKTKAVSDLPSNNIKGGNFGFYNLPSSPSSLRLWNCTIAKRWA